MTLQEVVKYIIKQVETNLSPMMGNSSIKGEGLAIQNPKGVVVSIDPNNNGERKILAISDNNTPRFYIRLLSDVTTNKLEGPQRVGSCGSRNLNARCRLVFMDRCKEEQKLLLGLQQSLFSINFNYSDFNFGAKKVQILDRGFSYNAWDIFNRETLKPKEKFSSNNLKLVSIDFDLRILTNYKTCEVLKIC